MKKFIAATIMMAICLIFGTVHEVHAQEYSVDAKAAIAVDAKTGQILFSQNADEVVHIASTTKLLSMYLVYEQIAQHKLKLTDEVKVSKEVSDLSLDTELSNVPLYEDQTYTVESLIYAGFLESANAAVMALAEHIAGSEAAFVDQMRAKLDQWQIKDGLIVNSTGLPNEYLGKAKYKGSKDSDENQLSAKDMMIVACHLVNDFPEVLTVTQTVTYPFYSTPTEVFTVVNTNQLLPGMLYAYPDVTGLKTGTTDLAGACFIANATIDGRDVITAVFDVTDGLALPEKRFTEMIGLLDSLKATWTAKQVLKANQTLEQPLQVEKGKQETVGVHSTKDVTMFVDRNKDDQVTITPTFKEKKAVAPITKNQRVGEATVTLAKDELGYLDQAPKVLIETDQSVEKLNIFQQTWKSITSIFS